MFRGEDTPSSKKGIQTFNIGDSEIEEEEHKRLNKAVHRTKQKHVPGIFNHDKGSIHIPSKGKMIHDDILLSMADKGIRPKEVTPILLHRDVMGNMHIADVRNSTSITDLFHDKNYKFRVSGFDEHPTITKMKTKYGYKEF